MGELQALLDKILFEFFFSLVIKFLLFILQP